MWEKLETYVIQGNRQVKLEVCYQDDVIQVYLDGELLCRESWIKFFRGLFERALEIWPSGEEYENTQD